MQGHQSQIQGLILKTGKQKQSTYTSSAQKKIMISFYKKNEDKENKPHTKPKVSQYKLTKNKTEVTSGAMGGQAYPTPPVSPVTLQVSIIQSESTCTNVAPSTHFVKVESQRNDFQYCP